jgi:amino acid adenylation domain-containing protein
MELSFRDYVLNEEALRQGPRHEADQAYWRGRLDELPAAPELPVRPRPDVATRFVRREAWLDADRWSALQARAAQRRVTPSALLLTAYAQVLGTWAEQDRFTLNLTLFNRNGDHPDLPALVGDFTALSLLAVDAATTGAFARRAERVQRQLWDDLDHRTMSGVQVVRELGQRRGMAAARMPVVFTSELGAGASDQRALLAGLGAEVVYTVTQTPQVWLDHQVGEDAGALRLTWDSVDAIFPDGMVDAMFAAYTDLLRRLADDGDAWSEPRPVTTPAADLAVVAATNDTAAPVPQGLLHEPFAARARQRPDATAVVSATGTVTYGELDRAADAAAATLQGRGVAPGDVVGVLMGRGWEQVAAVLGVLRAGAAYLPLDDGLPTARVAHVLRHAGARAVLVTEASERTDGMPDDVPAIRFAPDAVATPAPVPGDPDALAYVIYTSGSTGEPKGVMISHRGARNTIDHLNERFAVGPHDRVFGISGLGFDLSVYDVFGTLAAGGTLVLSAGDATRDPARWRDLIGRHGVTVWNSVPALMEMLLAHTGGAVDPALASLRLVWLSGDWIPVGMPDAIRSSCPGATVVSMGGATEASIWSVAYPVGRVDPDWPSIPYGRPLPNQSLHVLDEQLRPRPLWVPGDLYIGGVGVALGYRRAPELTEAAYLTHPDTGERLYRTGDRARFLGDGVVEFLGRRDSQVKVRGMRIELGEIEATLVRQDGVREAAVVVHGRGSAQQLVGFVVAEQPTAPAGQAAPPDPRRLAELDERLRRPAVRRDLADHRRVPLPAPGDAGTLSGQVRRWRSASTFAPGRLTVGTVGDLLAVLGQQLVDGLPRAAYASAGGRFPVQVYLSVHGAGVEGLAGGLYYHDPSAHTLTQLTDAALEAALYDAGNQPLFASSSFALFLVSKPSALGAGYAAYADRFCLLEAGSMAQLLRQRAPEVGAALCGIGDVHFPPLRDALALEPDQALLYSLLGGVDPAGVAGLEGGLRAALAERLPEYMVPRRIHLVDALPLSANGKVDRQALAARVDTGTTATAAAAPAAVAVVAAPTGDTLARLTRIWQELLETDTVDPTRNFFELGANSIHLVHAQRRIGEEFGREVSVTQLFDRPTLTDLAELLDGGPAADGADPQALPQQRRDHRARRRAARRAEGADDV